MANNLIKQEEKLQKSLLAILNSNVASGLKTKQFQEIFEKQINILAYLVKENKSKDKLLNEIIDKYKTIGRKDFTINNQMHYDDQDTLSDDINYLAIYVRNIYKIDMEALIKGKKADIVQSSVSEVQQKDRGFGNKFGSFAMPGFGAVDGLPNEANPYFISLANMRLNDEIRKGNIYAFKTKPKWIPLIKYLIVAFSILSAISCILVGVGMILCKNQPIANGNENNGMTWMGSFYLVFTICLAMIIYTILKPMLTLMPNKKKNDNFMYYFRWQNVAVSLGFFILFMLITLSEDINAFNILTSKQISGILWVWFIGTIMLIIGIGLVVCLTILAGVLNPKSDRERMETIIKEYIAEISSGKVAPPTFA